MKYVILLSLFIVNYYYEYVLCLTGKTLFLILIKPKLENF